MSERTKGKRASLRHKFATPRARAWWTAILDPEPPRPAAPAPTLEETSRRRAQSDERVAALLADVDRAFGLEAA